MVPELLTYTLLLAFIFGNAVVLVLTLIHFMLYLWPDYRNYLSVLFNYLYGLDYILVISEIYPRF